jgi:transposase
LLGRKDRSQMTLFIPGSLDRLIPDDHILKKVDRVVDFSWLAGEVRDRYCPDNGRPGIDPECALRLMLAGFFHGIVHDRKLLREAQVNLAIRWFAGYGLDEELPHHSSLGVIRERWGADRFKRIFQRTVAMCAAAGLVNVETVHVDATLIRADVSWESLSTAHAAASFEANRSDDSADRSDRHPVGTAAEKKDGKKYSATDPDATMATSSHRYHLEPSYKQHTAVDDNGILVDVEVTTGETSEGKELLAVLDRVEATSGQAVKRVTADAGYAHASNYSALEEREIDAVIPPQNPGKAKSKIPLARFKYDAANDVVRCPRNQRLKRRSRQKNGWIYRCPTKVCQDCPLRNSCLPPSAKARSILIVDGYPALLRARRRWPERDELVRRIYNRHRFLVEGIHGEAKTQHGLRRAVRRRLWNVAIQVYLTAAVINLKRLVRALIPPSGKPLRPVWDLICSLRTIIDRMEGILRKSVAIRAPAPLWLGAN